MQPTSKQPTPPFTLSAAQSSLSLQCRQTLSAGQIGNKKIISLWKRIVEVDLHMTSGEYFNPHPKMGSDLWL